MSVSTPSTLGKYEVLSKIGDGGMAAVYRARLHAQLRGEPHGPRRASKEVALKVIHPHLGAEREFGLMFFDEVRLAMALTHRNIVQTFDAGTDDQRHYLVMELVRGCSLRALLNRTHARGEMLPAELALFIASELCAALAYAHAFGGQAGGTDAGHATGVIHRDVSPSNVLLSAEGEVKLADFGVAKARGRLAVTTTDLVKGKLRYMAPEQARGAVEARSDLFSLGAVLYEMLCGRPIRDKPSLDLVRDGGGAILPAGELRPGLSTSLQRLVSDCLAVAPSGRPASAAALREQLTEEMFRLQMAAGQRRDLHAALRDYLATVRGEVRGTPTPGDDAARLARAVLEQALGVPTDHGRDGGSSSDSGSANSGGSYSSDDAPTVEHLHHAGLAVGRDRTSTRTARGWRMGGAIALLLVGALLAGATAYWLAGPAERARTSGAPVATFTGSPDAALAGEPRPDAGPLAGAEPAMTGDARAVGARSPSTPADAGPPDGRGTAREPRPDRRRPRASSKAAAPGWLDVNATPWARVYVDGHYRGDTPVQRIELRPGRHRLKLVSPRLRLEHASTIKIRSGQRLRRVIHLQ